MSDLAAACAAALSPTYSTGTHVVVLTAGSTKALVFYSFSGGVLGIFPWATAGADYDFAESATFSTPPDSWAHNLNATAQWYASPIGKALWLGNGVNANLWWDGVTLRLLLATPASGQYARAREAFPPCTTFVIGEQSVVYGAGNAADPQKVWLTERPVASEDYLEGVFSINTSFVKLLHQRGTIITALSTWSSYVVAHTNNGAVALFGFDQTNDGWICQQRNSAAGAAAANPYCARGLGGIGTMWLGTDGEIYKDESGRTGLEDKMSLRDGEIATRNSAEGWNRGLDLAALPAALAYDAKQGMAWVFGHLATTAQGSLWAFNEGLGQITGPYHAPNLLRLVDGGPTKSFTLLGLGSKGELLYMRPSELNEPSAGSFTWPLPALSGDLLEQTSAPLTTKRYVEVNTATGRIVQHTPAAGGGYHKIGIDLPTEDIRVLSSGGTSDAFFHDASLAMIEFPLLDMDDAGREKVVQQIILSWASQSVGWVGILAQNEKGLTSWRWIGSIYGAEKTIGHPNLCGARLRVRIFFISPATRRATLRDAVIGFLGNGVP